MLRTALAGLLALASVWEGPVTLPSDDHFNDTFQYFSIYTHSPQPAALGANCCGKNISSPMFLSS